MTFTSTANDLQAPRSYPWLTDGIAYGGDYNPEQWPEATWTEDVQLMREAGVTTVTLGVFSWGLLEVADGQFDWGWLDRVMNLLHDHGIGVDLATPTAAAPLWLLTAHPEIAAVDERGVPRSTGGRLAWSPSSPLFRHHALRMVRAIAERYAAHPALRMWHVGNELGNENARCYGDDTAAAWQGWLEARYGTPAAMNAAWGTAFWGHHATAFDQVLPPRWNATAHNPGLLLDFDRFTSDALLAHFDAERAVLREVTPDVPITTNFMVMNTPGVQHYAEWAKHVDIVANDHYTIGADPLRHVDLSFSADRTRGIAENRPWLLMEHSTSAVNWQGVNYAKRPGEMLRNSVAHVAHGADGVLFFQWRQSTAGAEQFHSGMLPHAGADSTVFRNVTELGALLRRISGVRGTTVDPAEVALLFDEVSVVAQRSTRGPSNDVSALKTSLRLYAAFTERNIAVDVIPPTTPLDQYALIVVPALYLTDDTTVARLTAAAERGATVLVTYLSGIVDPTNRVRPGGYPGAFSDLVGVRSEEFVPLGPDAHVVLSNGHLGTLWTETVVVQDAESIVTLASGDLTGTAVLTRKRVADGAAWYLATELDDSGLGALVDQLLREAAVVPIADAERGVEVTRRSGAGRSYLFAINHTDQPRMVRTGGWDHVSEQALLGELTLAAGAVAIVEESK